MLLFPFVDCMWPFYPLTVGFDQDQARLKEGGLCLWILIFREKLPRQLSNARRGIFCFYKAILSPAPLFFLRFGVKIVTFFSFH